MARLIDADAFEKFLMNLPDEVLCEDCCYVVVNEMRNQPTSEPKQEWISVKDRLPEQLKEVLICFDGYGKKSVSTATYRNYFYGKEWLSNMMSLSVDSVTHWMPLPEPPKEEE